MKVCVFITAVPLIKLFAWGDGESGGHVLRELKASRSANGSTEKPKEHVKTKMRPE